MNAYTNNYLREVVCRFNFKEGGVKWDSGYFGQYYDKIKDTGFTNRVEQKGIRVNIDLQSQVAGTATSMEQVESQMIFQNLDKGFAIIMGYRTVSFHLVEKYTNWDRFNAELLEPYLNKYLDLGVYEEAEYCQIVYLNQFVLPSAARLSEYYAIGNEPMTEFGEEEMTYINKNYVNRTTGVGLVYKFQAIRTAELTIAVDLECCANSLSELHGQSLSLLDLAKKTKKPIGHFFESLITDKLREIL